MSWDSEKGEMPYTMPKFTALAERRMEGVTSSGRTPKTWEAVMVWMSAPLLKPSIIAGSPAIWARSLSSIWE